VTRISTFSLVAAIGVLGVAAPAFAQSDARARNGSAVQTAAAPAKKIGKVADRKGLSAFANVPSTQAKPLDMADPRLTGGGSSGYNHRLGSVY
jgi:hypothetical protein